MTQQTPLATQQTVLILYSSRFGHSRKIAEQLTRDFQAINRSCECRNIEEDLELSQPLSSYMATVIIASVRYGFFHKNVKAFVRSHLKQLNSSLSIFMPVCLIARKPEKRQIETNVYARKFLEQTEWNPTITSITAGDLRYPEYNFLDRFMIKLIMKITKGETDPHFTCDYTDWAAIKNLAAQIDSEINNRQSIVI